ncbi:MAG: DegT/DnrJ/EryC1/StrS family aminotransferase, partial [Rhodospirillales bacterium]
AQVAAHLASLRQHGLASDAWARYSQPRQPFALQGLSELGYKLNYTDLQAAIGRVQLRRQAEFAVRRQAVADFYLDAIARDWPQLRPQAGVGDARHARHLFAVRLPLENMKCDRATLVSALRAKGIGISIHYVPLHGMPLYQPQPALPVTDFLADRIMTLPISASMSLDEARYCWSELIACLAAHGGHP